MYRTTLYNLYKDKARLINFFGWELPLEFSSILKEAKATRESCGIFDVSHMGKIEIKGKDSLRFLQYLTSNDISIIKENQLQYNLLLNNYGGIIDDLIIYNLKNSFLCIVNASNTKKDLDYLIKNKNNMEVEIIDNTFNYSFLSIQGPSSYLVMKEIFGNKILDLKYMHSISKTFKDTDLIISRSGYTGEDGFEIYCLNKIAPYIWDMALNINKDLVFPCGLGSRDILRIEAGYPLYGNDIDEDTNPFEASLEWVVKFSKDFICKEKLINLKDNIKRKRVGFILKDKALPRKGYKVFSNSKLIGEVTSGTYSPNLDKFIGMAYVDIDFAKENAFIDIQIRDKKYSGNITSFSFIKRRKKNESFKVFKDT